MHQEGAIIDIGTIYPFRRQGITLTWAQDGKLLNPGGEASDEHGYSVGVVDDLFVAGAPDIFATGFAGEGGEVAVFCCGPAAHHEVDLVSHDRQPADGLGAAVAIEGTNVAAVIVAGAPNQDEGINNAGAVYVFRRSGTWREIAKLVASDPNNDANLGHAVALHQGTVVAGAPNDDHAGANVDAGAAYVYSLPRLRYFVADTSHPPR